MTEASCSGGTAWKRLADHQSRDAGHHQDRLVRGPGGPAVSRRRPRLSPPFSGAAADGAQTFRSAALGGAHDPGLEFDAFLGEAPAACVSDAPAALPDLAVAGRLAGRAAAPPRPERHAPLVADVGGWAADFARFSQQARAAAPALRRPPRPADFRPAFPPRPALAPKPGFDQAMARWVARHGADMSDVDAAMARMARELQLEDREPPAAEDRAPGPADFGAPETGGLPLDEPAQDGGVAAAAPLPQPSGVTEGAERLLESVQHEDGEKWQRSAFLSLMRDLRDGRKDILGDEIRPGAAAGPRDGEPGPAAAAHRASA